VSHASEEIRPTTGMRSWREACQKRGPPRNIQPQRPKCSARTMMLAHVGDCHHASAHPIAQVTTTAISTNSRPRGGSGNPDGETENMVGEDFFFAARHANSGSRHGCYRTRAQFTPGPPSIFATCPRSLRWAQCCSDQSTPTGPLMPRGRRSLLRTC
jgi:hypothetical protein